MTTEVFKEMKDFSISELENVISLAKEELAIKRAEQRTKIKTDFLMAYDALRDEGIEIYYTDLQTGEDIALSRHDCFYFE